MRHLKRLMEAIRWQEGRNAQECLADDTGVEDHRNLCLLTPAALCVYTYLREPFALRLDKLPFTPRAFWYSPKLGGLSAFRLDGSGHVNPPADREDAREDWALLLLDENQADGIVSMLAD